jgi:hypothetical protein
MTILSKEWIKMKRYTFMLIQNSHMSAKLYSIKLFGKVNRFAFALFLVLKDTLSC